MFSEDEIGHVQKLWEVFCQWWQLTRGHPPMAITSESEAQDHWGAFARGNPLKTSA
jgi:hypothetical protein